jgi:Ca2+-binding RTX toxin-like protein
VEGSTQGVVDIVVACLILCVSGFPYLTQKSFGTVNVFETEDFRSASVEDNVITCIITTCNGNNSDDIIIGSSLSETIYGLKGNDNIQGNGGDDLIYGGDGGDNIQGGSKVDKIFGQDGNDYLFADSSTSLVGSLGQNKVDIVSRSNDSIVTLKTANISKEELVQHNTEDRVDLFAQLNVDILALEDSFMDGGKGDDHLYGGSGDDVLVGGPGHDVFDCGEGIDQVLDFNPKDDTLSTNCEIIY